MNKLNKILLIVSIILFCTAFSLLHILKEKYIITYTIVYLASSAIFLLIAWLIWRNDIPGKYVFGLLAVGLIIRISFIETQPIGSDDFYRYIWDGKVQTSGINPYKFAPNDSSLRFLHSDRIPKLVNFPEMKSIYFPLSQWLFSAGYFLSSESLWGYKLLLLIFEALTLLMLYFFMNNNQIPLKNILLYALCPLPIIQFSIDAHLDGFGLPLLIIALYLYFEHKKILGLIFLGLSFSIKPVGFLFLPLIFFYEKNFYERLKIVLVPILTFFILFLPYIFSSNPFEAFFIYARNWTFNGIVFDLLDSFILNNQTTRIICGALLVVIYIPIIFSKMELKTKFYYSILILMIFSPVVHPWYIAWLAVLLPIVSRWSGIIYTALSSLTVFTVLNYHLNVLWKEYPLVLIAEYLPVIFLTVYELRKEKFFGSYFLKQI